MLTTGEYEEVAESLEITTSPMVKLIQPLDSIGFFDVSRNYYFTDGEVDFKSHCKLPIPELSRNYYFTDGEVDDNAKEDIVPKESRNYYFTDGEVDTMYQIVGEEDKLSRNYYFTDGEVDICS